MSKKRNINTNQAETLTNVKRRTIKDEDGKELLDNELISLAVEKIDSYIVDNGTPPPQLDANFIEWLRDAKTAIDAGTNIVEYKNSTVVKQMLNMLQ